MLKDVAGGKVLVISKNFPGSGVTKLFNRDSGKLIDKCVHCGKEFDYMLVFELIKED